MVLSATEVENYHARGYIGPFKLCTPTEMATIYGIIDSVVFSNPNPISGHYSYARHQDSKIVYDLCTNPVIIERLAALYGPDLILWNSSFWIKNRTSKIVPWHQDLHYWKVAFSFTAWIAITSTSKSNGCLKVIPASHHKILPMAPAPQSALFEEMADTALLNDDKSIELELRAGEFVLFSDRILHGSDVNHASDARIGLAARYTIPCIKLFQDKLPFFPGHKAFLASGQDKFNLNDMGAPPSD